MFASALGFTATAAGAAETHYEGLIRWVKVNATCVSAGGPSAGDRSSALFHPMAIPGNGLYSSINEPWGYGSDDASLPNGNFDSTLRVVDSRRIGSDPYDPRTSVPKAVTKISITSVQPSYNPPPLTVTLEGQIQNPWADNTMNACIVDYIFTGIRNN
jgi:hypothetical protein